ncbi:wax ester/triacylglycerol synthase family O-acyltransferase [Mycobacterium persicum]|uniref:Diacylglycerol O-acyltransferase n=1 Tax=Mycobacterium persicum TaxID=1487726 RepID=A0A1X0LC79_9MYCO|nr:wax ester/triacylglycerol synthase family O-acyltransferase [Mycobacterium persicum]KZS83570.1 diacylglycerol O-acyltransferase [Mycobacterium persicum]ORB50377.1 wax ester/triacylglycerol synthase family O-acyltransferase [Mycobacterium persicum]ORB91970.1 wax ester/triacylglycerol synthase family O-acyltransferase [Mycobacterium persicum]ORB97334.1 wax ester/triacylglycerol synthase family O-acyltransferase [Mycobacterium persicum]ORC03977.1 wax ester/triacylglycerol synthase family O-acy
MNPLDPLDAAMMTAEMLSNPMHVGAVLILSPPPGAGPEYVDELYRVTQAGNDPIDPRLRRYPHQGVDTGGIWVWRDADAVDIGQHCQRRTTSGDGSGFWRLIAELDAERLDRSRPMWMSYLIDGLEDGRFAFYIKVHHTVIDGVAGFKMIADALSTDADRRSMPPFYAEHHRERATAATSTGLLPRLVSPLRSLVGTAASGVGLVNHVVTGEISTILDSLIGHTTVLPFGAPYTRFNGRLGPERAVAAGSWPKTRIQAVRHAARVTGNDVVTAMVAGALRRWLLDRGELPKQSLVAACPITVRGHEHAGADDEHGNMFGLWLCRLGTDIDDPVARLELIHRSMSEGKQWVGKRGAAASLLTVAGSIAATVVFPLLPFSPKIRTGYNVPISHVPGPRAERYWNGAHVDEIYPVSTVYDGQALNVTTCSYADHIGFGYVAGLEIVPDIETLIPLTEQCLTELETALGVEI